MRTIFSLMHRPALRSVAAAAAAIAVVAFPLTAAQAATSQHASVSVSATAVSVTPGGVQYTATLTIHPANAPAAAVTCTEVTGFSYTKSSPGYVQGYAYTTDCTGGVPEECSAQASIFLNAYYLKTGWQIDTPVAPTEYGCVNAEDASVITHTCDTFPQTLGYRTLGVFTIDYEGQVSTGDYWSPIYNLNRRCSHI